MASLTDTLATVDSGRRPIAAPDANENTFIGGLASIGKNLLKVGEAASARQATNAANAAELAAFRLRANPPMEFDPVIPDAANTVDPEMPVAPGEVTRTAERLGQLQTGAAQGRISLTRLQVETEAAYADLMQQFPGQEAVIAQTLRGAGVEHYLIRGITDATDEATFERESDQARRNTLRELATGAGYEGPPEFLERKGLEVARSTNEYNAAVRNLQLENLRRETEGTDPATAKAEREADEAAVLSASTGQDSALLTPFFTRLGVLAQSSGPGFERNVQEIGTQFNQAIEVYRLQRIERLRAMGASEAVIKATNDNLNQIQSSVTSIISGPASRIQATTRTLKFMEDSLSLDSVGSLTLFRQAAQILGSERAVNELFSDDPALGLTPETIAALKDERRRAAAHLGEPEGTQALRNLAAIRAGRASLQDMTPADAARVAPNVYRSFNGSVKAINEGVATNGEVSAYINTAGELANLGVNMAPGGQTTLNTIQFVANGLGSTANIRALREAQKSQPERTREVIQTTRLAMQRAIQVGQQVRVNDYDGALETYFNTTSGRWDVRVNTERYNRFLRTNGMASGLTRPGTYDPATGRTERVPLLTPEQFRAREWAKRNTGGIRDKVDALNEALDFMVVTTQDEDIVANLRLNERQYRSLYATGVMPRGANAKNDPAEIRTAFERLGQDIQTFTQDVATNPATSSEESRRISGERATPTGARNERNNNAGNIEDGPFARRQPGYTGVEPAGRFATFDTPEHGEAAADNLLANSYIAKGFDTPTEIINRWAPGPENTLEQRTNYADYVAGRLGIKPGDTVPPNRIRALRQAMKEFEGGQRVRGTIPN